MDKIPGLKNVLSSYFQQNQTQDLALLAFRAAVGLAFMFHGWPKIQNAFAWMGDAMPGFLQALAALSEFGGGIALALGLLTPLAALGILATMSVAVFMVHVPAGHPFVDNTGGHSYELALVYLTCALLVLLTGPGKFSVDYFLLKKRS